MFSMLYVRYSILVSLLFHTTVKLLLENYLTFNPNKGIKNVNIFRNGSVKYLAFVNVDFAINCSGKQAIC